MRLSVQVSIVVTNYHSIDSLFMFADLQVATDNLP